MRDYQKKGVRNQRTVLLKNMRKKAVRKAQKLKLLSRLVHGVTMAALAVLLLAGAGLGVRALLTSRVFLVKKMTVEGNVHLREEDLRRYEQRLAANIFLLDLEAVRRDLLEEPYVKQVFLRRELPDRVFIRIQERVPFAVLRMGKEAYLIDQEGSLLEKSEGNENAGFPLLTGFVADKEGLWKRDLSESLSLVETIRKYGYPDLSEIREIEMTSAGGAVLHPAGQEFAIRCGRGDFLHKMILLRRVSGDLARRQWPLELIDLRFQDQVVVRMGKTV